MVRNSVGGALDCPPVKAKDVRPRSPRYLSEHERIRIADLLAASATVRCIAAELGARRRRSAVRSVATAIRTGGTGPHHAEPAAKGPVLAADELAGQAQDLCVPERAGGQRGRCARARFGRNGEDSLLSCWPPAFRFVRRSVGPRSGGSSSGQGFVRVALGLGGDPHRGPVTRRGGTGSLARAWGCLPVGSRIAAAM